MDGNGSNDREGGCEEMQKRGRCRLGGKRNEILFCLCVVIAPMAVDAGL
jgi:hypothetical protein